MWPEVEVTGAGVEDEDKEEGGERIEEAEGAAG